MGIVVAISSRKVTVAAELLLLTAVLLSIVSVMLLVFMNGKKVKGTADYSLE
jgi:hypothetical protein